MRITRALVDAAYVAGVTPEVMQATVWIRWRHEHLEPRYYKEDNAEES